MPTLTKGSPSEVAAARSSAPPRRLRRTSRALLGLLALGAIAGCQQAGAAVTKTPPSEVAPASITLTAPLTPPAGPTPMPETFNVADLSEHVKPTVVNITTTHEVSVRGAGGDGVDPFEYFFGPGFRGPSAGRERPDRSMKQTALGTGFIIDPAGYVVTNEHVIHDADDVRVRLSDDREMPAEIVGRDPKLDLALLKIKGAVNLPAAPLGSSDGLRVGEYVLAVGNPFGLGHTVTMGIVSAKARTIGAGPYDDFIQTDASINPGNSGGPLFNWRGEVVGINTAIRQGANGIGFAIPIDALKDVLPQLRDKGYVERGRLGLAFQPLTPDLATALGLDTPKGALVSEVEPGGAAARAGIKPGDVIVALNGAPISHAEELPRRVAKNPPGTEIAVTVVRDGKRVDCKPKLDALDDDGARAAKPASAKDRPSSTQSADKLGIEVSEASGGGVRVDDILAGSQVSELQPGDVILEMNGAAVTNVQALQAAIAKAKPGSTALLKVKRGAATHYAGVPIPR